MKKLVIRYTMGPSNKEGYSCLKHSMKLLQSKLKIPAKFVICYNNQILENLSKLNLNCEFINQDKYATELPYRYPRMRSPAFKLYPPRLNLDCYEVMLDNDVIIYNTEIFEEFLSQDKIFITEAPVRSYSGIFAHQIKTEFKINSGVIMMPPGFDFANKIKYAMTENKSQWKDFLDEQALVAFVLQNEPNLEIIKMSKIFVCRDEYQLGTHGMHFVHLNRGTKKYYQKFLSHHLSL
jgi:hypothetical protein